MIPGGFQEKMQEFYRCYATVSLETIKNNILNIRKHLPKGTSLMAVLKADAYGHGAVKVGKYIEKYIDRAGVATVEEGVELRNAGFDTPILVLGYSSPKQFETMIKNAIMPTIYDEKTARLYSEAAQRLGVEAAYDIAIDTGMTRIGFRVSDESADIIKRISLLKGIALKGLFTHLSCADTHDEDYTEKQFEEYDEMYNKLKERGIEVPIRHVCNSAGIMKYPSKYYEGVRSGIITYGMYPSEEVDKNLLDFKPALEWKAHIINISDVEPERGVSYGATYITHKPVTRIATVGVGYADGYPRSLSSKGCVLIKGMRAPIIGRVCMDQMMVDITDIPGVEIEDTATLIGRDGDEFISIEELSDKAGSFNYEMSCGIGKRVKRVYLQ